MSVIIHHNPRCSKSRATLSLLHERGLKPEVVRYLDEPPTPGRLKEIAEMLGLHPARLVRTGEQVWNDLGLDPDRVDEQFLYRLLSENPILIERPIVIAGDRARIGRPPEAVLEILGNRRLA
jgi:arsenate reductase